MLVVRLSFEKTLKYLKNFATIDNVVVNCINSFNNVILSSDLETIDNVASRLKKDDVFVRKLKVSMTYHSYYMQHMI